MISEKFDWNDISVVPKIFSDIDSRSQIDPYLVNGKLPIYVAPMDTVINETNANTFYNAGVNIVLPRNVKFNTFKNDNYFYSYGLDEIIGILNNNEDLPNRVLIDVANGHMQKLYDTSKRIKEKYGNDIQLMVGNIAHPETYRKYCEIGVDYIRCGIGGGSACLTAANTSIFYPMASLIHECSIIAKQYENPTKIIADGGFRTYSDIIKALALGAHSVMLGGVFNKCFEACGDGFNYVLINDHYYEFEEAKEVFISTYLKFGDKCGFESKPQDHIDKLYKKFRGMSTKEVQKDWGRKEIKTSEGISKYNKVEYTLDSWIENFTDYLKSSMSYCGMRNLDQYIGNVEFVRITENAFNRFNK